MNPGYLIFQAKRSAKRFLLTPYFTPKKLANAVSAMLEAMVFRKSVVKSMPVKLTLDPTNICMLRCPLCPTGRQQKGRKKGKMDFLGFKKVVDEVGEYLYEIDLNNWGEPFLNSELLEMAEYAHGKKIKTSINSNMNAMLSAETAEKIVESGLDVLYVSFDGTKQESYEKYRVGGKLETVKKNLLLVKKAKEEKKSKKPKVVWQFLVMRHNEQEIGELEKLKKELGVDEVVVGAVRADLGKEIFLTDKEKIEKYRKWLPSDQKMSRYDYENKKRKLIKEYCYFPWLVSVINWDGSVSPCCAVFEEKYDFGNAFKQGFKEIWNNSYYQKARKAIATKKPEAVVCSNCLRTGFVD